MKFTKKHVHLFPLEKFTADYVSFINSNFPMNEHFFIFYGENHSENITPPNCNNYILIKKNELSLNLIQYYLTSSKFFIHYFQNGKFLLQLFVLSLINNKCYWVLWGADLYIFKKPRITIKSKIIHLMKSHVIQGLKGIIFFVKGEHQLANQWYNTKASFYEAGYFPDLNKYQIQLSRQKEINIKKQGLHVLIGNSANPTNRHVDTLNYVINFSENIEKIYCPLSYGGTEDYQERVILCGKKLFGEKFVPLTNFLTETEYFQILSGIDVAIFNADRQQALGNIFSLLYFGKKVFIDESTTPWNFFIEKGIQVYSIHSIKKEFLIPLSSEIILNNREKLANYLSLENAVESWAKVFNS
jgi:dTDP-N-acetylfucosamine:lipid II N-acetylfucosaminyltransferase